MNLKELKSGINKLKAENATDVKLYDVNLSKSKKDFLELLSFMNREAPDICISILTDVSILDKQTVAKAAESYCSLDIPLNPVSKGDKLLFDKKLYASKAALLNDYGLVFGFILTYAAEPGDSAKAFMERLDFATQQYPNHIIFPQTMDSEQSQTAKVTGLFSAQDIRYVRDVAFACRTFYTAGRAVPWLLSVLRALKLYPSKFFADFAEWQHCNNCDFRSGFNPEAEDFEALKKMQLLFLDQKLEEKNKSDLTELVHDLVEINGAMSLLASDGIEGTIKTSYHPDDLLGPESLDLIAFHENICMEKCTVKLFAGPEGPDYSVL